MFEWLNLFPPYLTIFTLVLVIFPTVITLCIRITLYNYLRNAANKVKRLLTGVSRGDQPSIVERLEVRFRKASLKLESVNTSALIEGLYSDEEFTFLSRSLKLKCESSDYFSKSLPNLLLAFGLLGTFLGITLNLTNISVILDQSNLNNSNLVQNLQTPLQSMGIAFITSLIALVCSSVLTIVNLQFNTHLAKNRLMSSLEDYLDNIFHPTIEGQTRLDKAVNRMVDNQDDFLKNFHKNVTNAVKSSLDIVVQKFADENKKAAESAKIISNKLEITADKLTEVSKALDRGSNIFERATSHLDEQIKNLNNIVQHENFVDYSKSLQTTVTNFREALEKITQNKVADKLVLATENLQNSQNQFSDTVEALNTLIKSEQIVISTFEQSVIKITNLGEQITELNQQSSQLLETNKTSSDLLIDTIEKSVGFFNEAKTELNHVNNNITNNTEQNTGYLREIESALKAMKITNLGEQMTELNQQSSQLLETNKTSNNLLIDKFEKAVSFVNEAKAEMNQINNNISNNSEQLYLVGDRLIKIILQESGCSNHQGEIIAEKTEQATGYLREIESILNQLIPLLNQQKNTQADFNKLIKSSLKIKP